MLSIRKRFPHIGASSLSCASRWEKSSHENSSHENSLIPNRQPRKPKCSASERVQNFREPEQSSRKQLERSRNHGKQIEDRARTSKSGCASGLDGSNKWLSSTHASRSQVSHASSFSGRDFGIVFTRFALLGFCLAIRPSEHVVQVRGLCDANQTGDRRRRTASRYRPGRLC